MTFSEFAKLLYPYIGDGEKRSCFVERLIENIMKEPVLNEDKKLDEAGKYIPYSGNLDMLGRFFTGSKSISGENARRILRHLDKERFEMYIEDFPDATLALIKTALQESRVPVADDQVGVACADLFVSILEYYANKKRKSPRKAAPPEQQAQTEDVSSAELYIEDDYKCCRFCTNWKWRWGMNDNALAECSVYKEPRGPLNGKGCKYYCPEYSRITLTPQLRPAKKLFKR